MEEKIRALLYEVSGITPLFNPMEEWPAPTVVDLSRDVTNYSRIYHPNTDAVREIIGKAQAVVCDSDRLANVVRQFRKGLTIAAPFGHTTVVDRENEFTIGVLNYSDEHETVNKVHRKFLKAIGAKYRVLSYGKPLDWEGIDHIYTDSLDGFCATCDVLLLLQHEMVIPSWTLPLTVMMAGTVVLATPHWGGLASASGVMIMPDMLAKSWINQIHQFEQNLRRLDSLKRFNANYAKQISKESQALIFRLAKRLSQ